MATFATMKSRIATLTANHLTAADVGALINRVHQEEVENHAWHRLRIAAILNTVAPITTGTVSATQGSTTVIGVGTAFATADIGKYIRINGDDTPLKVATRVSGLEITVETAWAPANVVTVAYSLFPLRYALPTGAQKVNWIKRTLPLVETTQEWLNAVDPERTSTADYATHWAPAERSSTDLYQVELWPVANTPVAYAVEYLKGHTDLSADGDTPLIASGVIENKAMHDCMMSMYIKTGHEPFFQAATAYYLRYTKELEEALIRDRQQYGVPSDLFDGDAGLPYDYAILHNID